MNGYTLEQVQAMPWPVDTIASMMVQSSQAEERHHIASLKEQSREHYIVLETELPVTEEVPNENEITIL